MKLYQYKKCNTCSKARKFLEENNIDFEIEEIRDTPPSIEELTAALASYNGDIKRLFNTSGMDYRALNMKERLAKLSQTEALALLASNGNLIKRPFLITPKRTILGFKEEEWVEFFS